MTTKELKQLILAGVAYGVLVVGAIITLVPMVWMICASLKTNDDFFSALFLPPAAEGQGFLGIAWDRLTFQHFKNIFTQLGFGRAMLNSFFFASVSSVMGTLFCAMGGYALSKFRFRGREHLIILVLAALIIPGPLLLAPGYQWLYQLGLLNSYAGLILPGAATAFGVFLFRQSMLNAVPGEMLESARIDGCGEIRIFFVIVIPLVKPTIGAFLLLTFLGAWNNFIGPQIIMQSADKFPLSVAVAQLKGLYSTDYGMLMAGTLISVLPIMMIFLLLQKEFVAGLTEGAVKG